MSAVAVARETVAIVNDDKHSQNMWALQVAEAGYEPCIIHRPKNRPFKSVDELRDEVERHAPLAVFDHRLIPKQFATFTGAETVAALYDRGKTAALLVTTWETQDVNTTIRRYRKQVPLLLSAQDFADPDTIRQSFEVCAQEVRNHRVPPERRPWRTAIQIEGCDNSSSIQVVDALVAGWDPEIKVRFPLDLIAVDLQPYAREGAIYFAMVNVGAEREEDLFFSDFELAPEPDPNDGLA